MKTKILSSNGTILKTDSIVKCNGALTARLELARNFSKEVTIKNISTSTVTVYPARREFIEDTTLQVETSTVVGTVTGAGNATVVVTAAGMEGSPITLSVPVVVGDTATIVARKIRSAMVAHAAIGDYNTGMFDVSGSGATVVLTQIDPAGNDATLNISVDNGTCTGLTTAGTSTNTTAGVALTLPSQNEFVKLAPTENGWVVVEAGGVNKTETMTNKTLTTPVLTTPLINGQNVVSKSIGTGHADITLSETERKADIIKLTGTGDGGFNLIFNVDTVKTYLIDNQTGQACTCKNAAGTTIAVATTKRAIVWNDGTNIVRITADA